MLELDTAAIVHREESGTTVHDFGGSGIRHHCARRVDHLASTLNEYKWGIWNVGGETTGSGHKVWGNMLAGKVPFTEVVREVCIIKKAAHGGLNHSKNRIERVRGFSKLKMVEIFKATFDLRVRTQEHPSLHAPNGLVSKILPISHVTGPNKTGIRINLRM